jgi:hypothetical protein
VTTTERDEARGRPTVDVRASVVASLVAAAVVVAIVAGSRALRDFDAALVGYATATVFLAFGVTYRYMVWVQSPPARRWFRRGWGSFLSWRNFRREPTRVPRALVGNLGLQRFIAVRGTGRWLAHQALFWGVVLATLVTFPLTFGWVRFEARPRAVDDYTSFVAGLQLGSFDATSLFGWIVFHLLDIVATIVVGQLWALTVALDAWLEGDEAAARWIVVFQAASFVVALLVWRATPRGR